MEQFTELAEQIRTECGVPLVTKWLVIAEVIDEDGDKGICQIESPDLTMWDAVGMLSFQLAVEKARLAVAQED